MADAPRKQARGRDIENTIAISLRVDRAVFEGLIHASLAEEDWPGRPEMVRRIVRQWLIANGHMPRDPVLVILDGDPYA